MLSGCRLGLGDYVLQVPGYQYCLSMGVTCWMNGPQRLRTRLPICIIAVISNHIGSMPISDKNIVSMDGT